MLLMELENGTKVAVRPSGTEPKIQYYMFGRQVPAPGERLSPEQLQTAKTDVPAHLADLWKHLQTDAQERLAS
jgi:phosphoglucomutase